MNVWQFWQDSLAGRAPEVKEGDIHTGFFRTRRLDPVAIWQADGVWYAKIGTKVITQEPDIADLFAQVCRAPVKHPDYMAKMVGEPWPDETALPEKTEEEKAEEAKRKYAEQILAYIGQVRMGFIGGQLQPFGILLRELEIKIKAEEHDEPWREKIEFAKHEAYEFLCSQMEKEQSEPAGIGHNSGSTLDQIVADMAEWDAMARKLMAAGPITDQATADKLSDIATKLGEFESQADSERKAEKDPHFRAGQAVDAKWKPVIDKAAGSKRTIKAAVGEFLKAQAKKLADATKVAAEAAGVPESVVNLGRPRAGAKRAVVLKNHKFIEIVDLKKAAAYFAEMEQPPEEFVRAIRTVSERLMAAGLSVPGTEIKTEQRAA